MKRGGGLVREWVVGTKGIGPILPLVCQSIMIGLKRVITVDQKTALIKRLNHSAAGVRAAQRAASHGERSF